jgi:4-hydroxythreonine-4-phosphate dehydrogenase
MLPGKVQSQAITSPEQATEVFASALPVFEQPLAVPRPAPGEPNPATAPAITGSIETAVAHVMAGKARAVVTNPISKKLLYDTGFRFPGHTEFLAELASQPGQSPPHPVMMLVGGGLRVALATIHMPLREAVDALTIPGLMEIGRIVHQAMVENFRISHPRLAFTGLNPHAGEKGTLGREEIEIINPAAEELRGMGVDITYARPADTVFAEALAGKYDAIIAMTHDQGLIPVKTLDIWGGVNTTLGLPFVRTSPDHGTAYDAAREGTARPDSLITALKLADDMSQRRTRNG